MLTALRRWMIRRTTDVAVAAAPRLTARGVEMIATWLARCGPYCPVLAGNVSGNMRALGVYSPAALREYFAWLGVHFAGALHALRVRCAQTGPSSELAAIARQQVELDQSVERLRAAAARGAILVGPHISNYLVNLVRLSQELPLTVYLRYSKDPRRRLVKQRWYQAGGVQWISEPAGQTGALGRLGRMAAALRAGRILFITPDLPQKRERGVPVRFFDREIYLPAGPAALALRTGAPLFMLLARPVGNRQLLFVRGPLAAQSARPGCATRHAALHERLQWFADGLEQFAAQQTPLWYMWGDKRWTRLLRDDARYARRLARRGSATQTSSVGTTAGVS